MSQVNVTESQIRKLYKEFFPNYDLKSIGEKGKYVVKVDEVISGRFKKGLIKININKKEVENFKKELIKKGHNQISILPYVKHDEEFYFSVESFAKYDLIRYCNIGGINIENNWDKVKEFKILAVENYEQINEVNIFFKENNYFKDLYRFYLEYNFSFLEINPYIKIKDSFLPLDFKGRIDSCANIFANINLNTKDESVITKEEKNIKYLDKKTSASLKFNLINENGRIWPLVAGGGASIVYFDLINKKFGPESLAFYGEYSGNPSLDLVYEYVKNILSLMLKSKAKNKILLIGGGNANFTDISKTFDGIINAMKEIESQIKKDKITIVVRRGGPNDILGLKKISNYLKTLDLRYCVYGVETPIENTFKEIN